MQTISITLTNDEAEEVYEALENRLYWLTKESAKAKELKDGETQSSLHRSFLKTKSVLQRVDDDGRREFFGW